MVDIPLFLDLTPSHSQVRWSAERFADDDPAAAVQHMEMVRSSVGAQPSITELGRAVQQQKPSSCLINI